MGRAKHPAHHRHQTPHNNVIQHCSPLRRLADHGVTAFLLRHRLTSAGYPIPTQVSTRSSSRPTAAAARPENPYCSCRLTRPYSCCHPCGELLLQLQADSLPAPTQLGDMQRAIRLVRPIPPNPSGVVESPSDQHHRDSHGKVARLTRSATAGHHRGTIAHLKLLGTQPLCWRPC